MLCNVTVCSDSKQVYKFAFIMQPLKAQGITGSTVTPAAVR